MGLFQKKPKEPELTRLQKNAISLAEAIRAVTAQAPGPAFSCADLGRRRRGSRAPAPGAAPETEEWRGG